MGGGGHGGTIPLHDLAIVFGFSALLASLMLLIWVPSSSVDLSESPTIDFERLWLMDGDAVDVTLESDSGGTVYIQLIPEASWEAGTTDGMGESSGAAVQLEAGESRSVQREAGETGGHVIVLRGDVEEVVVKISVDRTVPFPWLAPVLAALVGGWGIWRSRLEPQDAAIEDAVPVADEA